MYRQKNGKRLIDTIYIDKCRYEIHGQKSSSTVYRYTPAHCEHWIRLHEIHMRRRSCRWQHALRDSRNNTRNVVSLEIPSGILWLRLSAFVHFPEYWAAGPVTQLSNWKHRGFGLGRKWKTKNKKAYTQRWKNVAYDMGIGRTELVGDWVSKDVAIRHRTTACIHTYIHTYISCKHTTVPASFWHNISSKRSPRCHFQFPPSIWRLCNF
jgi:hypothetical protein